QNCSCSESKCCALELNFPLIAITPRSLQKVGRFVRLPTQIDPVPNGQQLSELDPIPSRIDKSQLAIAEPKRLASKVRRIAAVQDQLFEQQHCRHKDRPTQRSCAPQLRVSARRR